MRIPGMALRTPVTITPAETSHGDGTTAGTPKTVRGDVTWRRMVVSDTTGQTLTLWATIRVRPSVKVGVPPRTPAPGDTVTVAGMARKIGEVRPIVGAGRAVSYLEIVGGDSAPAGG